VIRIREVRTIFELCSKGGYLLLKNSHGLQLTTDKATAGPPEVKDAFHKETTAGGCFGFIDKPATID
jgi:hypothetical protein